MDDLLFENDETVQATISNFSQPQIAIATATTTATIVDNDNSGIAANLSVGQQGEEGVTDIVYTVTLATTNNTGGPKLERAA